MRRRSLKPAEMSLSWEPRYSTARITATKSTKCDSGSATNAWNSRGKKHIKAFSIPRRICCLAMGTSRKNYSVRAFAMTNAETVSAYSFLSSMKRSSLPCPRGPLSANPATNITLVARIIILHYINSASGIPFTGEKMAYGDIPACMHYDPVFEKRVFKPLVRAFGYDKYAFKEAGKLIGAREEEFGDASFTLFAFPKVPITFILWEGDEEFPPRAKALFDPSITGYLPLEDIVVICETCSGKDPEIGHETFQ